MSKYTRGLNSPWSILLRYIKYS